jgi:hypothetical protein
MSLNPEFDSMLNEMYHQIDKVDELKTLAWRVADTLKSERDKFNELVAAAHKLAIPDDEIIKFNVGGKHFSTLKSTVCKQIVKPKQPVAAEEKEESANEQPEAEFYEPNLLEALVTRLVEVKLDEDNAIFIDRSPKHFATILDYLRMANTDQKFELPTHEAELIGLLKEADFFRVVGLKDLSGKLMESAILSAEQVVKLMKLCKFKRSARWKLLYRGSRDGFGSESFHYKCDSLPHTLVVVRATNGNVFGGYTDAPWTSNGTWTHDPNAFLFSLVSKDEQQRPVRFVSTGVESTYSNLMFGPTFGGGYDLYIADNANTNTSSYSNLGYTFKHGSFVFGSGEATAFLAGSFSFQVEEIEVFHRVDRATAAADEACRC